MVGSKHEARRFSEVASKDLEEPALPVLLQTMTEDIGMSATRSDFVLWPCSNDNDHQSQTKSNNWVP